ncbi:MAG TPA: FkbM family methyltransferase [Thermoanaerobaculia bacterium]|nr:FkbM family methyltransferase [Thermoanaerobaculia bacterium]
MEPGAQVAATGVALDDWSPPTLVLPNGLTIGCQSRMEAEHIYEDIFDKRIYLRHGVALRDGATVLDVGGNIGLFTLFVHGICRDPRTYTFEPAPPLYRILSHNAARHCPGARLFNRGVAAAPGRATLTFYPYSSGMSSFHANLDEEKDVLRTIMANQRRAGMAGMERIMDVAEDLLDARFTAASFECELVTLSQVIVNERLDAIDLLKVDVQKCELEVLLGIEPRHWPKVRQLVMEVHALDGRLEQVFELLRRQGFSVVVEQDPLLAGSVLYNLFAVSAAACGGRAAGPGLPQRGALDRASLQRAALRQRRPKAAPGKGPA